MRYRGLDEVSLDLYDPSTQSTLPATDLVIRARGNPVALASLVRDEARRLAPGVIVDGVTTLEAIVGRAWAPWRFGAWVFTLFALVATALTAVGLFSVVALDVAQRRREFAVRLALGAPGRAVAGGVLSSAVKRVGVGVAAGVVAAAAASSAVRGLLYGVPALDVPTYAGCDRRHHGGGDRRHLRAGAPRDPGGAGRGAARGLIGDGRTRRVGRSSVRGSGGTEVPPSTAKLCAPPDGQPQCALDW